MHEPVGRVQFGVFEKLTSACLFQIAREKSCDYMLIIYMKKYKITKCAHQAKICKNNLFKTCVRSKKPRTIKTIICSDIFTSLSRKKIQSAAKQFKKLFITFDEMKSSPSKV